MRLRLENRGGLGKKGAWRKKGEVPEKPSEGGGVRHYIKGSGGTKEREKKGSKARLERKGE